MRVAVLFENFGPYHLARLSAAAAEMNVLAVEMRPRSATYDWERPDVPSNLEHVCLGSSGKSHHGGWQGLPDLLDKQVGRFEPDAVAICGWAAPADLRSLLWAHDRGIPTVVMSESNRWDGRRFAIAEQVKRRLMRSFAAGLCGSARQRSYLVELGLAPEAIFLGYNAVDNDYFATRASEVRAAGMMPEIAPGRRLDALWWRRYFLASARFVPMKNLLGLIEAYAVYRSRVGNPGATWPLVILGDGGLRPVLERRRQELGLDDAVHLPGFKQYDELPAYYATAGAFVHASSAEPWGLVVNEAMASGLPVLVSSRCGCANTLVAEGHNGWTFDPSDRDAIAATLARAGAHSGLASMGEASRGRIAEWGPRRFAEGLRDAARYARDRGPPRLPRGQRLLARLVAQVNAFRV